MVLKCDIMELWCNMYRVWWSPHYRYGLFWCGMVLLESPVHETAGMSKRPLLVRWSCPASWVANYWWLSVTHRNHWFFISLSKSWTQYRFYTWVCMCWLYTNEFSCWDRTIEKKTYGLIMRGWGWPSEMWVDIKMSEWNSTSVFWDMRRYLCIKISCKTVHLSCQGGKYFAKVKQRRSCLDQNTEISRCPAFRQGVESAYLGIFTCTNKHNVTIIITIIFTCTNKHFNTTVTIL